MSTVDPDIVRIAERRLHLVTDAEVQRLGLSERSIRRLVGREELHRVLPGVLSTTRGPYDVSQRELALCLSIPGAVLSHHSAAAYWGIRRAPKDRVDITVPKNTWVADRHAVIHFSNLMPDHHVVDVVDGARVTSIARSVFDLGGVLDEPSHLSVIEDVRNKGLCTDAELGEAYYDLCGRGRRGSAAWQRLVTLTDRAGRPTMSELELMMQEALVTDGLPPAEQQHPVTLPNGRTVHLDLAYVHERLDIEIDHSEWHATPTAVEQDKNRDLNLALLGWAPLRFTDRALERQIRVCVAMVRRCLDLRRKTTASG
jgi:very-short-patch-repair endonuclease